MSRAFTKEDGWEEPVVAPRAPLPEGVPNYVTPRGLALLHDEAAALEAERAAFEEGDLPDDEKRRRRAVHVRRAGELAGRIAIAQVVEPPPGGYDAVRFGAEVTVRAQDGSEDRYRIVGVDEADPEQGRIAFTAPIARALLGAHAGDAVAFGRGKLTVLRIALALLALALGGQAEAATTGWRSRVSVIASDRFRYESVNWFETPLLFGGEDPGRYDFAANQLRLGLRATLPNAQFVVEVQDVRLLGLPTGAAGPAPYVLGPGSSHFAATRQEHPSDTFVRQAAVTVRVAGASAGLGRFELADGLEALPGDADLVWLKRARIAERLLGPFGYTHVGRTFDGVRLVADRPAWNATAIAVRPTGGGFALEGGKELSDVDVAGVSVTLKRLFDPAAVDARAFAYRYGDDRVEDGVPVRVDNRPLVARQADREPIAVTTFGGHAATVLDAGAGRFDALAWGALQRGSWGVEPHRAWGGALEVGYQWPRNAVAPWVRAGINVGSGDRDPGDGRHGTFFPMLPTPRVYALFPFYNAMNLQDRFVQLIVRPHPAIVLRADYHALRLDSSSDLWYAGGGAVQPDAFGVSGAFAPGERRLANVIDGSITANPHRRVTLYGYLARAIPGEVIEEWFGEGAATYGYVEATLRY